MSTFENDRWSMDKKYKVVFVEWANPLKDNDSEYKDSYEKSSVKNVVVTPMGLMPAPDQNPVDIQFYIMHTNFDLTEDTVKLMEEHIDGVETLDVMTRYRARVGIGNLFNAVCVKRDLANKLLHFVSTNDKKTSKSGG